MDRNVHDAVRSCPGAVSRRGSRDGVALTVIVPSLISCTRCGAPWDTRSFYFGHLSLGQPLCSGALATSWHTLGRGVEAIPISNACGTSWQASDTPRSLQFVNFVIFGARAEV